MDDNERAHVERDYFAELLDRISVVAVGGQHVVQTPEDAIRTISEMVPPELGQDELWSRVLEERDRRTRADALRNFAVLHVGLHGTTDYSLIMAHAEAVERGER
jgi:hypothetical protein